MVEGPRLGGTFQGRTVIDPVALAAWMRSPQGPIIRELLRLGDVVKAGARRRVGVSKPDGRPPQMKPRTRPHGTLRDSIVKRLVVDAEGVAVLVGSEDEIAMWHHEGTDPHVIRPVRRKMLSFMVQGEQVFARVVHHPGTAPNRFLEDALDDIKGL